MSTQTTWEETLGRIRQLMHNDPVAPHLQADLFLISGKTAETAGSCPPILYRQGFRTLILPPRGLWPEGIEVPEGLLVVPVTVTAEWDVDPSVVTRPHPWAQLIFGLEVRESVRNAGRDFPNGKWPFLKETGDLCMLGSEPVQRWTQGILAAHHKLLAEPGHPFEKDGDEEEEDDPEIWRQTGVNMVVVCASDEHLQYIRRASVLRRTWILCVVLATQRARHVSAPPWQRQRRL
jgi:hypothetical protein